jgi:signal transduction histidine kinase
VELVDGERETFLTEEVNRLVAERVPLAAIIFVAVLGIAWIFEHRAHPERDAYYAWIYLAEVLTVTGGALLVRRERWRGQTRPIAVATTIALLLWVAIYNVLAPGDADVMALAFLYILSATMVVLPWGWQGQLPVAIAAVLIYPAALAFGAMLGSVSPNSLLGLITISGASVASAGFMASYRSRLMRHSAELRAANAALQQANEAKNHFLASVSHELRTPLNVIVGYADLLSEGHFGELDDEARRAVERITLSSRMLTYLINDLIDLARIDTGHLTINPSRVPLDSVLESMRDLMMPRVAPSNVELHVDTSSPLAVFADRDRLEQILVNLLSNAVKFTERGKVCVRARLSKASAVAIEVQDTGPGITDADLPTLFEPFVQGAAGRERGGVGIGLSLSVRLAKAMGGSLSVQTRVGEGTTFTLLLPAAL